MRSPVFWISSALLSWFFLQTSWSQHPSQHRGACWYRTSKWSVIGWRQCVALNITSFWINKHFSCLNIFQVWKPSKVQKLLRKSQKNWRQSQEAQMKLNPKHRRSRKVRTNLSGSFSQYLTCHNRKPRFYSQLQQRFFDIVPIIHFEFFTPAPFLLWCVKENGFRVCETQINSMCLVD